MTVSSIQVEVNLQDYFFSNLEDAAAGAIAPLPTPTWESWFSSWLDYLQPGLSASECYELSLRLTDNAEIQSLNAQYRQKDQPTDVLAFAALEVEYPELEEALDEEPLYLGDIVISVETAQVQAQERHHTLHQELAWLATHGLLHLLGWDHPDEESLSRMLQQQADLLQTIGLEVQYD